MSKLVARYKHVLVYGLLLSVLLLLLKWMELKFIIIDYSFEIYIGFIALLFTTLGIWLALKLAKPKIETVIVEKEIFVEREAVQDNELVPENNPGLSKRELEVLELIARGLSNQEIAGQLFVSVNTIKTHTSKLFEKMDVQRRTQAIEKAKRLKIIA